jgi:hypothetical protein
MKYTKSEMRKHILGSGSIRKTHKPLGMKSHCEDSIVVYQ